MYFQKESRNWWEPLTIGFDRSRYIPRIISIYNSYRDKNFDKRKIAEQICRKRFEFTSNGIFKFNRQKYNFSHWSIVRPFILLSSAISQRIKNIEQRPLSCLSQSRGKFLFDGSFHLFLCNFSRIAAPKWHKGHNCPLKTRLTGFFFLHFHVFRSSLFFISMLTEVFLLRN